MSKQSIFGRIAQLTRANINSLLDQAEDPSLMLDQLVRDYTSSISEAESAVAQTIGNLRLIEQDHAEDVAAAADWERKARAASGKADELRAYMTSLQMAKAEKAMSTMDSADKARRELVETLSKPVALTSEFLQEVKTRLGGRIRKAAQSGETEVMVMRFPVDLCTDKGRAINNNDPDWPESLTGRPRQAYELWRDYLRAGGYKLKAMIIEWPAGMPGDVGFFLSWSDSKQR